MQTRRVVGVTEFGGPDQLSVHEVKLTTLEPGEVRIAVHAAAVNPTDTAFRSGGYGDSDFDPPYVPGMDAAGVVESIGDRVTGLEVGDRVMAVVAPKRPAGGAYTDHLTVPAEQVIAIPDGATLEEAATLPMNGLTAKAALDALDLDEGQTFALTGAAGLLGSYAIPLAKARGLHVIADAKDDDVELVRSFGADEVVARGDDVGEAIRAVTNGGADGLLDAAVQGMAVVPGVRDGGDIAAVRPFDCEPGRDIQVHQVMVFDHLADRAGLQELRELAGTDEIQLRVADTYEIQLRVADTYAPEDAPAAHRRFAAGGVRGRLLLVF